MAGDPYVLHLTSRRQSPDRRQGAGSAPALPGDELIAGMAGRSDETSRLDATLQQLLSTMT
ncbi:MAG: hypothetical protein ACM3ML_14250 [Micromonosporaceae bacterium]